MESKRLREEKKREKHICKDTLEREREEEEKCYLSRLIGIQVSIDKMSKKMDAISLEIFHWTGSSRKVDQF